jgi:hypothetical protein
LRYAHVDSPVARQWYNKTIRLDSTPIASFGRSGLSPAKEYFKTGGPVTYIQKSLWLGAIGNLGRSQNELLTDDDCPMSCIMLKVGMEV